MTRINMHEPHYTKKKKTKVLAVSDADRTSHTCKNGYVRAYDSRAGSQDPGS